MVEIFNIQIKHKNISINKKILGERVLFNKKLIILAIFFVSLLAVSVVSAADNATDDVVSVEEKNEIVAMYDNDVNNTVISNENDYVLSVEQI